MDSVGAQAQASEGRAAGNTTTEIVGNRDTHRELSRATWRDIGQLVGARWPRKENEMAWELTSWACGHAGSLQLYGPGAGRKSRIASEAGRKCLACWLLGQWRDTGDPRYQRKDRFALAQAIAEGKGIRIRGQEKMMEVSP